MEIDQRLEQDLERLRKRIACCRFRTAFYRWQNIGMFLLFKLGITALSATVAAGLAFAAKGVQLLDSNVLAWMGLAVVVMSGLAVR